MAILPLPLILEEQLVAKEGELSMLSTGKLPLRLSQE